MDIETTLLYNVEDGTRPFIYIWDRTEEERKKSSHQEDVGGDTKEITMVVRNGRGKDLFMDKHSFQLVQHTTVMAPKDFYDSAKVAEVYYPEMARAIQMACGAAHVHILHHRIRARKQEGSILGYSPKIHSDSHPQDAEEEFVRLVRAMFPQYRAGRFAFITAWRSFEGLPVNDNHLTLCDETSIVKPDDCICAEVFKPDGVRQLQYRLNVRNSAQHRWYYFPQMTVNEVVMFKNFDSDRSLAGRLCFHTAIPDPTANGLSDAPSRVSVEARGIAFFPDHSPNTCPIVEQFVFSKGGC